MNIKLSLTLSLLLGSAVLFQGCSSSDDTDQTTNTTPAQTSTTIEGSTTLASGPRTESKATVCLDLNSDNVCNGNEPQAYTNSLGDYELTIDSEVTNGTIILVEGGISMLPQDENSTGLNTLQMLKYYNSTEGTQNVNAMSTLILQELQNSPSDTYEDILANVSTRYTINENTLLKDPIDVSGDLFGDGKKFFRYVAALEIRMNNSINNSVQRAASLQQAAETDSTTSPSDEELNSIISEYSTVFDDFLASISEYIDELSNSLGDWYDSIFDDEDVTTDPEPDPEPTEPTEIDISKEALQGTWYIVDASNDISCTTIVDDVMTVRESDGTSTELSAAFDNTKKSLMLSMGWISVDTILFTSYTSDRVFLGKYKSDGETMRGQYMTSESACLDLIRQ